MQRKHVAAGILGGAVFGTAGIFLLGLLSNTASMVNTVVAPLLWPGRQLSLLFIQDGVLDAADIAALYVCSGVLYALVGAAIQIVAQQAHHMHDSRENSRKNSTK